MLLTALILHENLLRPSLSYITYPFPLSLTECEALRQAQLIFDCDSWTATLPMTKPVCKVKICPVPHPFSFKNELIILCNHFIFLVHQMVNINQVEA